jgi:ADP-heptose:LPS heptosyltransferase
MEIFPQYEDYTHAIQMLDQIGLVNLQKRPIGMCPGGAKNPKEDVEARRWPPENFATLSRLLLVQTGVQTILIGAPQDEEICFKVASLSGCAHNLAGKTTFRELAALLKHCSLLVSNDSAPIHAGVAVGIPVIGLFGPTNGAARGPKNGFYVPIQSPKSCSPCYANENRFPECRSPNCMREISVNTVLKEAMLFLEKISGPTISM